MSLTYQDIHLEDKALWQQLKTAWDGGDYSAALNVLKQAALSDKQLNAATLNAVTTELTRLQNQKDTDFKMDRIKVATEPPSDLAVGEVYFKDLGVVTDYSETGAHYIEPNQKTSDGYDVLKIATQANQTELTYDTARAFGVTGISYTLDKALYTVKQLLDYIATA